MPSCRCTAKGKGCHTTQLSKQVWDNALSLHTHHYNYIRKLKHNVLIIIEHIIPYISTITHDTFCDHILPSRVDSRVTIHECDTSPGGHKWLFMHTYTHTHSHIKVCLWLCKLLDEFKKSAISSGILSVHSSALWSQLCMINFWSKL